jgi:transcriptional regulator of acetoin/glycerol metabolism
MSQFTRIEREHLHLEAPAPSQAPQSSAPLDERPLSPSEQAIRDRLVVNLIECKGDVSLVAKKLEKNRTQIYRWLKQFHIDANDYRPLRVCRRPPRGPRH